MPWIAPIRPSQSSRRRNSRPRSLSERSPPTRNTDTPNSMVNRVRILSAKKTSVTHRPMTSAWLSTPGGGPSDMVNWKGQAKEIALTARMPRIAQPRSMSRL